MGNELTGEGRAAIVCRIPMSIAILGSRGRATMVLCASGACFAFGCSTSDRFQGDAGAEPDAAMPGAPDASSSAPDAGTSDLGAFGAACAAPAECESGLFCDAEVDQSFSAVDLPPGVSELPASLFPGGSCTPTLAAVFDGMGGSCDPGMPLGSQGCEDGVCVPTQVVRGTAIETWYACRRACDPSHAEGCGRVGYTCDFFYEACVEGCQSDDECRLRIVDLDLDGQREFQYDPDSRAFCDPKLFRCVHDESAGGAAGDACERLDDCEGDGLCLEALQGWAGFPWPGGFCTKVGCDLPGRECGAAGTTCAQLRTLGSGGATPRVCLTECTVGADAEGDRLGADGHGAGCRAGYRCHYNGGSGAEAGVCVGGNYNAIEKSNLGAACDLASECYSPFGLGQCLSLSVGVVAAPSGVCTIMDCAAPGLPEDICGDGAVCLGLNGDRSFCIAECASASDCAAGFACADDDGDLSTPRVCFPACYADEDCRKGDETCDFPTDPSTMMLSTVGQCVPG